MQINQLPAAGSLNLQDKFAVDATDGVTKSITAQALRDLIRDNSYGAPLEASTVTAMTDTSKVYVYTGNETGYVNGNWYYYNGTAWVSGGAYNSVAVNTDTTLTLSGVAADAKATGDAIAAADVALSTAIAGVQTNVDKIYSDTATAYENLEWPVSTGQYCLYAGFVYKANQDIPTIESWNPYHWTQTNLGEGLSDLSDVQGDIADLQAADTALNGSIIAEATAREAADNELTESVFAGRPSNNIILNPLANFSSTDTTIDFRSMPLNTYIYKAYSVVKPSLMEANIPNMGWADTDSVCMRRLATGTKTSPNSIIELYNLTRTASLTMLYFGTSSGEKYRWLLPTTNLTKEYVPVDAKAVGDAIATEAAVRESADNELNTSKIDAYNMTSGEIAALTSLLDMPIGSRMVVSGARINELESNFPFILGDTVSYIVYANQYVNQRMTFDIETVDLSLHYRGRSNSGNTAIDWYNVGFSRVSELESDTFQLMSPSEVAALTSLVTAPVNRYFTADGSRIKELNGGSFPYAINNNSSYIVTIRAYGAQYRAVTIETTSNETVYYGGTHASSPSTIVWYDSHVSKSGFENRCKEILANSVGSVQIYTNFEQNVGWWQLDGTTDTTNSHKHTQKLAIRPNTTYYTGYIIDGYNCYGVFYDCYGNKLSYLTDSMVTEYQYALPDGTGEVARSSYSPMFKFTTPSNAYYISFNFSVLKNATYDYTYRSYLASKPIFATNLYGDLIIRDGDKIWNKFNKRKLCVVGTSQIMIDRLSRTGKFNGPDGADETQYVSGVQEYLIPWYDTVDSYGYSNAAMMYKSGEETKSIYTRVVTDQLDLSGYDDYFITHSSVGLTADNIGDITSYDDLGNNTTYIGALRQIVNYIYTQNPNANIYVQTRITRAAFNSSSTYQNVIAVNEKIRKLAKLLSLTCVDTAEESGFNYYVAPYWCYDENGHNNQVGNYNIGLAMRKAIIGV